MYYAQFYRRDLSGALAEGVGDRSVVIIDGRLTSQKIFGIAREECNRRGFTHYRIFKGDSFTRSGAISQMYNAEGRPVYDPFGKLRIKENRV